MSLKVMRQRTVKGLCLLVALVPAISFAQYYPSQPQNPYDSLYNGQTSGGYQQGYGQNGYGGMAQNPYGQTSNYYQSYQPQNQMTGSLQAQYYVSVRGQYGASSGGEIAYKDASNNTGTADLDSGWGFSGALGYHMNPKTRIETELSYFSTKADGRATVNGSEVTASADIGLWALMVNGYYHFMEKGAFSPYIGLGLGMGYESESGDYAFAYQGLLGLDYTMSDTSSLSLGYKYFATSDFSGDVADSVLETLTTETSLADHVVELGYRYDF